MKDLVLEYINRNALIEPQGKVCVGVSGGLDSVVTLRLLAECGFQVSVAHVNYGLRGAESDLDEEFVIGLCNRLGIQHFILNAGEKMAQSDTSIQTAAREIRYTFFEQVAIREGISTVATGHHRDDQAETLLLHLFRGTGLGGLSGMPPKRPLSEDSSVMLIRPMLACDREQLRRFAMDRRWTWREDASNESPKYARSVIRHDILPVATRLFGEGVTGRIARTAEIIHAVREAGWLDELEETIDSCRAETDGNPAIRIKALEKYPSSIIRTILLSILREWNRGWEWSSTHLEEVENLIGSQTGRFATYGSLTVWRERDYLVARKSESIPGTLEVRIDEPGRFNYGSNSIFISESMVEASQEGFSRNVLSTERVSRARLSFPLTLRSWKPGDNFQPFGMRGRKKVSEFLADQKVATYSKSSIPVLVDSDNEIVWVIPHRLSEKMRVSGSEPVTILQWN